MTRLYNKSTETLKRKNLRSNMPPAEVILWSQLKGRQIGGYKFRRQYSVEKFVVDFYCPELKLAIEIDGESHFVEGAVERDEERQRIVESTGIRFVRFTNRDIYEKLHGVLCKINECVNSS